jgi:hypothetical protein
VSRRVRLRGARLLAKGGLEVAPITSIIVTLRTDDRSTASTDDPVYLGVVGRGGGGEFALLAAKYDDQEAGSEVIYQIGEADMPPIANPRGLPVIAVPLDISDLPERYQGRTARRTFRKESAVQLSTESGLQVWIPEVWPPGDPSPTER